ncbi:hypothetical protein LAZ67_13000588 [Cordylochernes scorpioides]|uniref:Mariner Mos1 transposase n=1 Tax=Cordylochernes scorpioides TaxID=51811 RepID=A0ABY6L338_9ARAC|nr:hypothetical protein LAZ67_13000588 [Cordylochernes scorpioides]
MEAPLKDCTTLEQRAVIRFLNAEGIQTSQICQRMKNIYGKSCLSQKTFINGLTSSKMDELHVPILSDLDDQENIHFYHRQRMNSDLYCDILVNKLKPGIRNKRRGKLSKGVIFLHDNARPHTSCKTVSIIIKLDLAPSDYFLFGLLKELKGKRFDSDEDVQKVVQEFFHTLPKSAYKEGIYKLPERWRRCIESQGNETWIYNFDPETKRQSTLWCSSKSPPPKKVCRARSVGKQMVAYFLEKYLKKIKQSIPRAQLRRVLLHKNNARLHTSAQTSDFLANSGVQLVTHPPYSPDLAPCDFFFYFQKLSYC